MENHHKVHGGGGGGGMHNNNVILLSSMMMLFLARHRRRLAHGLWLVGSAGAQSTIITNCKPRRINYFPARIAVSWPTYPTPTSALATVLPSLHQSKYLGIFLYICCFSASTHCGA